jgi:Na+-transporting NADH:ubiquinone oxidoreductase subunit C
MNINSNGYVFGFAVGVCVVISAALALTSTALKPAQDAAAEFDRQKNVMMAAGLVAPDETTGRKELEQRYRDRVQEVVIDTETGQADAGKTPADVAQMKRAEDRKRYRVVAISEDKDGKPDTYILPISGKGLWSTIYGYLALEGDATTVRGVTFYKHGETPGLGGECENPVWCAQWRGKKILDGDKLVGIEVKKGKVDQAIPAEKAHKDDLQAFDKYLSGFRKK